MSVAVEVRHRLGAFALEAAFENAGQLIALFGPSGSGKSSLINVIGGLIRPQSGRVVVNGRVLVDTERGIFVPKHRRRIGYVFQDARLFPHLTVSQNLRYGRFFTPTADRYADFAGVVDLLGIGGLLDRRPNLLSGGEKQRVAIGRALIASPKLLLMDEPLASLDDARKAEILPYLERLRDDARVPIVYVSHSVAEVARLATDGSVRDILGRLDLLPDEERAEGGAVIDAAVAGHDGESGLTTLASPAGDWRVPRIDAAPGSRLRLRIRARDVMIATERPNGVSALNVMPGVIHAIGAGGQDALVSVDCNGDRIIARVTPYSARALGLAPGLGVFVIVKAVTFDRGNVALPASGPAGS
jgi:molybdate transport system ATP-binding protein